MNKFKNKINEAYNNVLINEAKNELVDLSKVEKVINKYLLKNPPKYKLSWKQGGNFSSNNIASQTGFLNNSLWSELYIDSAGGIGETQDGSIYISVHYSYAHPENGGSNGYDIGTIWYIPSTDTWTIRKNRSGRDISNVKI